VRLIEFNNDHYEAIIGSAINVPDNYFFKAALVTADEVKRYKKNGGDWINYKGYLRQYLVPGSPIVIADNK